MNDSRTLRAFDNNACKTHLLLTFCSSPFTISVRTLFRNLTKPPIQLYGSSKNPSAAPPSPLRFSFPLCSEKSRRASSLPRPLRCQSSNYHSPSRRPSISHPRFFFFFSFSFSRPLSSSSTFRLPAIPTFSLVIASPLLGSELFFHRRIFFSRRTWAFVGWLAGVFSDGL